MSYSDDHYAARSQRAMAFAHSFGTATASGATGHTLSALIPRMPKFKRRSKVTGVKLVCSTIPNAASTGVVAIFLNGTATFGTAVLTTATANQQIDATITSEANSVFAAESAISVNMVGTSTASGAACGAYDVWVESNELFSN